MQEGQLATNNAKNQESIKHWKQLYKRTELNTSSPVQINTNTTNYFVQFNKSQKIN